MGKRGPKPTPTKLLELRGSWRGTARRADGEPDVAPYRFPPHAPACLGAAAAAEWARVARILVGQGVLTPADRAALVAYCQAWGDMVDASAKIERCGMYQSDERGRETTHPAVKVRADAQQRLTRYAAMFGLTPADRRNMAHPAARAEASADSGPSASEFVRRPA